MAAPVRILVTTTDASGIGGVPRATRTLVRALADLYGPQQVGLLSVWRAAPDVPCELLFSSSRPVAGRVGPGERVAFFWHLFRNSWRWRRDAVSIACHPHLGPPAWLVRLVTRTPYAVWCHGEEVWGRLRRSTMWSLRRADLVFAPSNFTARRVEATAGLPGNSVVVLPHCLPPELSGLTELTRPPGGKRVLTVARLVQEHAYKGVDVLIEAWPRVVAQVPDAELVVVGDGADKVRLESLAQELGVTGSARFAGAGGDEELRRWYAESSVFVLPSRTRIEPRPEGEGFGLVFIEAAAAGLPAVAARGGAVDEVVADGSTGLLVPSDDPGELAAALIRLLEDEELATKLGEQGRRRARTEFGYETFRERVADLVSSLRSK